MRFILFGVFAVSAAWGQASILPLPTLPNFEEIRAYLALSDEQVQKMLRQNTEFAVWSAQRQRRSFEVQLEIAVETAKSPLDPGALGVRYAEVESIRREIAERSATLVPANVALLTETQKVKLKALEEALKLVSTGNQAKSLRLLPDECPAARLGGVLSGDFSANPPIGVLPIGGTPGCTTTTILFDPVRALP